MTQDERWLVRYNEVKGFIEKNHRNPSKYYDEEKIMHDWVKHDRKMMNKGELKLERLKKFEELLGKMEENKRVNQYK